MVGNDDLKKIPTSDLTRGLHGAGKLKPVDQNSSEEKPKPGTDKKPS